MNELIEYLYKLNYNDKEKIDASIFLLEKYMDNILMYNKKVNVTSIREKPPFIRKHYMDSISIIEKKEFLKAKFIIDIGTGGGFPGVPLAILFSDKEYTLVDSVGKKINVIKESIKDLNLNNIRLITERAEILGKMSQHREKYDLCVSRAVAPLNYLLEFALPLVKVGGSFIAYKGPGGIAEIEETKGILKKLGGKLERIDKVNPFYEGEEHILMVFNKEGKTLAEYPRRMEQIKRDVK